jgi:hypothetical protein
MPGTSAGAAPRRGDFSPANPSHVTAITAAAVAIAAVAIAANGGAPVAIIISADTA